MIDTVTVVDTVRMVGAEAHDFWYWSAAAAPIVNVALTAALAITTIRLALLTAGLVRAGNAQVVRLDETIAQSREHARSELRAYVHIESATLEDARLGVPLIVSFRLANYGKTESPRDSRRLHLMRGWSHGTTEKFFAGGAGTRRPAGAGADAGASVAMGGHQVGCR